MIDKAYIKKMRAAAKRDAREFNANERNRALLKKDGRGEEPPYQGTTFLFIRGFDGDTGERPIPAGQVFWISPDVELFDATGVRVPTSTIRAGEAYTIEVVVTNAGDRDCNSCAVELFLTNPALGFQVATATVLGNQLVSVARLATSTVRFPFTATADMVGHRCLFARVASFITNDLPSDWSGLNANLDRHLGQQNLDIVQQGTTYSFNVHLAAQLKGKNLALTMKPNVAMAPQIRLPAMGRYLLADRPIVGTFEVKRPAVMLPDPVRGRPRRAAALTREAPDHWTFKSNVERETMEMAIPNLGLRPNEMVPMDLRLFDPATGAVIGGITLLVVG